LPDILKETESYRTYRSDSQCCQLAKISAAKRKTVSEQSQRPRKAAAEFNAEFLKNGRKGAFEGCFSIKILDNLQH
jgi:hypothetical protein